MRCFLFLGLGLSCAVAAQPDIDNGAFLHAEHCGDCHMVDNHEGLYTRQGRIDNRPRLSGQVSACVQVLDLAWFPEEESDVAAFLNETYYRFDTP